MFKATIMRLSAFATLVPSILAISVQENYTICSWARLRAGIIRDAIYLDGGELWWQTAFADGTTPVVASDGNVAGDMFRLNLSMPFDTTKTNMSALLDAMPKAGGAGNNIAPNYIDGTMFTNDDELYLYGGLARLTDSASPQSSDVVLGYEAYQYGPNRQSWQPGFYQGTLPEGVTRYITNGAGASAPSENLGFYFSGMRAPDWGPIFYDDSSANVTSNTLIEIDMSTMRDEKWTNTTLPDNIVPRANAELVWLPVSDNGVLIAIGGVTDPEEIWASGLNQTQQSQSEAESPSLMTSIPVYDIASKQWYLQNTTGESQPPQLTEFCSVAASVINSTSFNIYIYGGYDGLNAEDEPSDDVWVLSVPSFIWTKVYSGQSAHGRSGHRCIATYPDKMFVIGGVHQDQSQCAEGGFLQVFNLNTLEFQSEYSPADWQDYSVPESLKSASTGISKRQVQWSSSKLEQIFSTKYPQKIQHYYPYKLDNSTSSGTSGSSSHKGGSNHTVAIAVGVAAGVVVLILIAVIFLIFRRRSILRSNRSESSTTKHSRISKWIVGTRGSAPHHSKMNSCDSSSSLNPEAQQVSSYTSSPGDPEAPRSELSAFQDPMKRKHQRHEMAAVERPLPPFEMATPYNMEDQPRNSALRDYAYNTRKGHSGSPSRSTSSENLNEHNRLSQPHTFASTGTTLYPDDSPSHSRNISEEEGSHPQSIIQQVPPLPGTSWPLPSSRPTWLRSKSKEQPDPPAIPPPSDDHPAYPPMPQAPAQYRSVSQDYTPNRLRPILPDSEPTDDGNSNSYNSNSHSSSSGQKISSLSSEPSPENTLTKTNAEEYRQSLLASAVSPISPEDGKFAWHGHQRRNSGEKEMESWWKGSRQ